MADYDDFVKVTAGVEKQYTKASKDPWSYSPFGWIKKLPSRTIGAIGEKLVAEWAESKKFKVERTGDSQADRLINGKRIEIKFSTLWANKPIYKFQQIRDQNYEYCFCLGVSPNAVHAWLIPKKELMQVREGLTHQHGGAAGTDTYWLDFDPTDPPAWLKPFGGTLSQVEILIKKMK
jgi:hypothetical protein